MTCDSLAHCLTIALPFVCVGGLCAGGVLAVLWLVTRRRRG